MSLPENIATLPAVIALNRALDAGRLPHGILLAGEDLASLRAVALALSARLLDSATPESHPDFHELRPSNKMRRIGIDDMRDLIREIQISSFAGRKVGIITEADRMAGDATNAFLKTLEEPPPGTTLLLLTCAPNAILDTIRSRCLLFKIPAVASAEDGASAAIEGWLDSFSAWHADLRLSPGDRPDALRVSHWFLGAYGLVATFQSALESVAAGAWKKLKGTLPEGIEEEQLVALETSVQKNLRARFFSGIIGRVRIAAHKSPGDESARRLAASLAAVERQAGLLEVNLADDSAMEALLLQLMRIETAKE